MSMHTELITVNKRDWIAMKSLVQRASNLIADDLTDSTEKDAPEHFRFLRDAAELLRSQYEIPTT